MSSECPQQAAAQDATLGGDYLVTTFPIGARGATPKLGLLTTSLVADVLARRHDNVESRIALNVLDSYQDRRDHLQPLVDAHATLGIDISNAWIDTDPANMAALTDTIGNLAARGYVKEEEADVIRCDDGCLRVEMLADAKTHPEGRLYTKVGELLLCNTCQTEAKPNVRTVLTMQFPDAIDPPATYHPSMQSDVNELTRRLEGMRTLVSRSRTTGLTFEGDQQRHNIDIDFFWMNYLASLAKGRKGVAVVGSNHVRRHLTTIHGLHQAATGGDPEAPELKLVMPSYITPAANFDTFVNGGYLEGQDPNALRMLLLSSVSWLRDGAWASSAYKYIQKRLRAVDWRDDSRTSVQQMQELHDDCERIRGGSLTQALRTPDEATKHAIRGVVI